ncbi:DUF6538 domain-containing protein [Stenotrophomonas sp. TWI1183]|uniref:DUF6538 domain-containing protein n=1 Tax=Stenotrophomonas sp. TWI1183 TaxID=3136799 RepID=UPI003208A818
MRIPDHLIRNPSGTYAFCPRAPSDLQSVLRRKLIKQTLRASNLVSARLRAIIVASGYAHAYDLLRDQRHPAMDQRDNRQWDHQDEANYRL